MLTAIATLDTVLEAHREALGRDFGAYRNHTYRVVNLCVAQGCATTEQVEKVAIAAAFHDLGIWTDHTFDYLEPSIRLACEYLSQTSRPAWAGEITSMIAEHHKVRTYRSAAASLVEPFRRADWTDVTFGIVRFGVPRRFIARLYDEWPSHGFHRRLVGLEFARLRSHPLSPLPMLKL
jgi:hypothetical protein